MATRSSIGATSPGSVWLKRPLLVRPNLGTHAPNTASDGDDDLAAGAAVSEVADGLGNLGERERPVDDGRDRAGFEQLPQLVQILRALLRDERAKLLPDEGRERGRSELTADAEPVACVLCADDDERAARRKRTPQVGERAVARDVKDYVVRVAAVYKVLAGVVDHMIGTDRAHDVDLARAADAGHLCPACLCDLHCERADPASRTDDQHPLPGLNFAVVADRLQGGIARNRDGRGLFEAEVRWLGREAICARGGVFGKGTTAGAKDVVARPKQTHVPADRLDASGDVVPAYRVLRPPEPETREAHHVWHPGHQVPDTLINTRRTHAHQHLVLSCNRLRDFAESQNVDRAVGVLDDRLHRVPHPRPPRRRDITNGPIIASARRLRHTIAAELSSHAVFRLIPSR